MAFDWTISIGNILSGLVVLVGVVSFFLKLHHAIELRLFQIEMRLGGHHDDKPISQQLAVLAWTFEERSKLYERELSDLNRKNEEIYRWWVRAVERRAHGDNGPPNTVTTREDKP